MHAGRIRTSTTAHRPRGRRRATTVLAAILAAVAVGAIAAPAASAHGPGQNGCTAVPDSSWYFDFHAVCDRHDRCYDQLWYGGGYSGRLACDRLFHREMNDSCYRDFPAGSERRKRCFRKADEYYTGVRLFGGPAFNNPNIN